MTALPKKKEAISWHCFATALHASRAQIYAQTTEWQSYSFPMVSASFVMLFPDPLFSIPISIADYRSGLPSIQMYMRRSQNLILSFKYSSVQFQVWQRVRVYVHVM